MWYNRRQPLPADSELLLFFSLPYQTRDCSISVNLVMPLMAHDQLSLLPCSNNSQLISCESFAIFTCTIDHDLTLDWLLGIQTLNSSSRLSQCASSYQGAPGLLIFIFFCLLKKVHFCLCHGPEKMCNCK